MLHHRFLSLCASFFVFRFKDTKFCSVFFLRCLFVFSIKVLTFVTIVARTLFSQLRVLAKSVLNNP